jgi:ribonucleoside-diphosphate reductase alpha chain
VVDYVFHWLERKFGVADAADAATPEPSGIGCPDCGSVLAYQEGCLICRSCGYNRCG